MQDRKLEELTRIGETCLTHAVIDLESVAKFCRCLKRSCEEMRDSKLLKGKKEEQAFCRLLVQKIIKSTQGRTSAILADLKLKNDEKADSLANLAYMAQSLIALTIIQHRFGGRLGYHCLPHSQSVVQYPDFMVMCAGANHDVVMKYAKHPDFNDPKIIQMREAYHQSRSLIVDSGSPLSETHRQMYALKKGEIKTLKNVTEQKRIAGWKEGCSERDSVGQLEAQLEQLIVTMEKCDEEKKYCEAIEQFKKKIKSQEGDRAALIKGTIPAKCDFAPPHLGDKLNTIGNVSVLPGPAVLAEMEQPLRGRIVHLMDNVIKEIKGVEASNTFKQALEDIYETRRFYHWVVAEKKAHPSDDLEEIKAKVRKGMKSDKPSLYHPGTKIPRFETMNEAILAAMPPFNDPMKQLKEEPQDTLIKAISAGIQKDVREHRDMLLIEYLMKQMKMGLVGNHDLGALMKEGAENEWLHNEIIGLIVEENPYQSQLFFTVNHKLLGEGGLSNEAVQVKLRDPDYRNKWGITEEEYQGVLEFTDISFYFMNENLSFSQGAILRMLLYVYLPMKALQKASEASLIQANIKAFDKTEVDHMVHEFERSFCQDGKLRDSILQKIKLMIDECLTAGSLSRKILSAMEHQFGPHFLKEPQGYGFTIGNVISKEFLEEQNNWRYD